MKAPAPAVLDLNALWEEVEAPPASSSALRGERAGVPAPQKREPSPEPATVPVLPAFTAAGTLDPCTVTAEGYEAAQAILKAAEAPNTRKAYQSALKYWKGWYAVRYCVPMSLPVPVTVVLQFLTDHLAVLEETPEGLKTEHYGLKGALETQLRTAGLKARHGPPALNTILHRIAVLSQLHEVKRLPNPCRDIAVKRLLSSARKIYGRTDREPKAKCALTQDLLTQLLDTCEEDLKGIRDRAILTLAFASGGRRRSEVVGLRVEDLARAQKGNYTFTLKATKTDQSGERKEAKPVNGEAAEALDAWLKVSGLTSGPLFRKIIRGQMKGALTGDGLWWLIRSRAAQAGLSAKDFGAHSLRSGFVTEAARRGISIAEIMKLTGHRSAKTALRYYQSGEVTTLRAANLLTRK